MDTDSKALHVLSPKQIVQKGKALNCTGIAFLMNDPLASFFTFLEVCKLAKQAGLVTGCSSNGYFTLKTLDMLIPYLDFINIGLKGLSNAIYQSVTQIATNRYCAISNIWCKRRSRRSCVHSQKKAMKVKSSPLPSTWRRFRKTYRCN